MTHAQRPTPLTATGVDPDFVEHLEAVDPADLPKGHPVDARAGADKLSPRAQLDLLLAEFSDSYPEIFTSLTTDEGAGVVVSAELKDATERMWARVPDLITHSSLLVLGAGLDHAMPGVAFLRSGPSASDVTVAGLRGTVLRPSEPTGAVAVSLHGGPGWFGDAESHDQLWLPLFAALAEKSGVTVVDLLYPLPGYGDGSPAATAEAVSAAVAEVRERVGEFVGAGVSGASADRVGLITFGSGLTVAGDVVEDAAFLLAMTPRIPDGLSLDLSGVPTRVSVASEDSRGTAPQVVLDWFTGHTGGAGSTGADFDYAEYLSEHIIGVPDVWRRRVSDDAAWLAGR
ncbi:hypothetical protein [Corynebacterium terpenotabidum]|nr:hypothetical protein [Corynebacterium terpenotabidum]